MHPDATSAEPGLCPICRMELEPVGSESDAPAAVRASTYQTYDTARSRAYGPDTRAPAWIDDDGAVVAVLYDDELAPPGAAQRGTFFPASSPSTGTPVAATPDRPAPWDRSTSHVRFRSDPGGPALHAGDVGWLKLAVRQREAPVVPSAAVLEGADGAYVLVASGNGRLLGKRPVAVGRVFGGMTAVLSGLRPAEHVLVRGAFYVDAERRLRHEPAIEVSPR